MQDFYQNFGFGEDDVTLIWMDVAGINTIAIQELNKRFLAVQQENDDLKKQLIEINNRLENLEK